MCFHSISISGNSGDRNTKPLLLSLFRSNKFSIILLATTKHISRSDLISEEYYVKDDLHHRIVHSIVFKTQMKSA